MKKIIKEIWRVICYPIIYIGSQFFVTFWVMVALVIMAITGIIDDPEIMESVLANNMALLLFISCAFTFLFVWLLLRKEWKQENFWRGSRLSGVTVILCVALSFAIYFFITGFTEITHLTEIFTDHDELMEVILGHNILFEILAIGLVGPFVEEIIFRGIILRRFLKTSMKIPLAICLQALLFGVIHMNVLQGLYAFLIGVVFGLVYVWCDSIWLPVIMHSAFNLISVILSNLPEAAEWLGEMSNGAFAVMAIISIIVSAGLMYLIWERKTQRIVGSEPTN